MMSRINTLIKPTHECNMRCKYCFHEKYGYSNRLLELEKLKRYIYLLSKKYHSINIVWHGGEPLMVPLTYYEEIYDFCKKQDAEFIYSLQTNGTLLNQEIIDFFKINNTSIGLSFDGLSNSVTRANTSKILDNIRLLHDNDFYPGAIMVVNQYNVDHLIEEYQYFKSLNLGLKINPMFNDGAAKDNCFFDLNPDDYIRNFVNFFKYWSKDKECNINVSTCEELVNLVINEHSGVCTFNSCLGKWLCFDSNGCVYPCDRLCIDEYNFGDINDIVSINDVFQHENFLKLLKNSISRRSHCIKSCEYYKNCYSGCNANAMLSDVTDNNVSCYIQKGILNSLKQYILESKKNLDELNYNYVKILNK